VPDYLSWIIFVGGLSIFVAMLFYARAVFSFRQHAKKSGELMDRAMLASRLPPDEAQREFDLIRQEFRALIDGQSAVEPTGEATRTAPPITSHQ
jgi:hypothetical protein